MTYSVTYSIYHDGKILKNSNKYIDVPCFASLKYKFSDISKNGYVEYFVPEVCSKQEAEWYFKGINEIGLTNSLTITSNFYVFRVQKQETHIKTLAILTAIRYLEEGNGPKMIKWAFEKFKEHINLSFFDLFKLMHYSVSSASTDHGFINGLSVYGTSYCLCDLNDFVENLKTAKEVNCILSPRKEQIISKEDKEKIPSLLTQNDFNSVLQIINYKKQN
jgi:hypothetical protein